MPAVLRALFFASVFASLLSGCPSTTEGACSPACTPGVTTCCPNASGRNSCVFTGTDVGNCGSCGNACAAGARCMGGTCVTFDAGPMMPDTGPVTCPGGVGFRTCPEGMVNCAGYTGDPQSDGTTDLSFTNCGVCGRACDADRHNRCAAPSTGSTPRCLCGATADCSLGGDMCVNMGGTYTCFHTNDDEMNCGAVGNACAASELCIDGECVCDPVAMVRCDATAGETCCASTCVDLTTDVDHCGACGDSCATGETCGPDAGGAPACSCAGVTCDAAETCVADVCVCNATTGEVCDTGESCCGGTCIDTSMDPANCGGCGVVCGANTMCNTVGGVTGCYCGTEVCAPVGTMVGAAAGGLCCDDGAGNFSCVVQDGMNCRECGRACDDTGDMCVIANPSPGDPPGARPCCRGDVVPIFGFCSDDFGG